MSRVRLNWKGREALERLPTLPGGWERLVLACAACPCSEQVDLTKVPTPPAFWAAASAPAQPDWGIDRLSERVVAWVDQHAACELEPRSVKP